MGKEETKNILVWIELSEGTPVKVSLEALSAARDLADQCKEEVIGVVCGSADGKAAELAAASGADRVIAIEDEGLSAFNLYTYADVLHQVIEAEKPSVVLAGGTVNGKDLIPQLAAMFDSGAAADVIGVRMEEGNAVFTMTKYNGSILSDVVMKEARPQFATIRSGAFRRLEESHAGRTETGHYTADPSVVKAKVTECVNEITESINLEDAEVIVSGGRGMGSKENFALVEQLAGVLGGEVGATRPAIEDGWITKNHQVGQSGKCVAPKLYIAAGISGATQHLSGMTGSDYIVAINKDENAPIFSVANVGIVGDAVKILPLMIEAIKKQKEA